MANIFVIKRDADNRKTALETNNGPHTCSQNFANFGLHNLDIYPPSIKSAFCFVASIRSETSPKASQPNFAKWCRGQSGLENVKLSGSPPNAAKISKYFASSAQCRGSKGIWPVSSFVLRGPTRFWVGNGIESIDARRVGRPWQCTINCHLF